MNNQGKGKKKIKSSKDLYQNSLYQEKYDKYETKQQKKEHQHQLIQSQQNLSNDTASANGQKQSKEEIIKQFPNKMMNLLTQQFKKLEQSSNNLKVIQVKKDYMHPELNLNPMIVSINKEIFTQFSNYQQQQNSILSEQIRGSPDQNLQLSTFNPANIKVVNPFSNQLQTIQQLISQLE